ncbi:MAG: PSD1 domain-containing protein [Planctomycetaceae bacterium]|nr:PSD1 domain-containing protein [Planctomycetaceae bacterium]
MRLAILCCGLVAAIVSPTHAAESSAPPTFEHDIRPILRAHCLDCHGASKDKDGNLDLRLVRFQVQGGDSGPAIVPGQPDDSLLLQRIRAKEMPPGEVKLSDREIALFEQWIAAGATTARPEPEEIPPGVGITPEEREWWAYRPIVRPHLAPSDDPQVRTPVDALLRSAMPEGLHFSPEADRLTLLKRATLDLTGLPPTSAQIRQFVESDDPAAYERLIDDLLASPRYGERWARHWLDIAGYADSGGVTSQDSPRPWAYKYRDYVIQSFNAGKPLDRFIHEQLAGDELGGPITGDLSPQQIELFTATGFLRMANDGTDADGSPEARNQVISDTIKIVSSSLLGLTVACAQCHDHRYDPIPQADYYSMRSVFEPALNWNDWRTPSQRVLSLYTAAETQKAAEIDQEARVISLERNAKEAEYMAAALDTELMKYAEPLREQLRTAYKTPEAERTEEQKQLLTSHPSVNISPGVLYQYNQAAADELKKYDEQVNGIMGRKPVHEYLQTLWEPQGQAPKAAIFHRGDHRQPLEEVAPAALQVLGGDGAQAVFAVDSEEVPTTGRRLAFARWITSRENPITARVLANRIWLHHFGRGLVSTPADFGRLGTLPTHPELLDWLADELFASGWDVKAMHRTIMLSTAYRQSSVRDPEMNSIDRENHYYWRRDVQRIDAETMTDRVLAVTQQIDDSLYGPAVAVKEDETGQVTVDGEQRRRTVYLQQRRSQPVALLQAFDAPVMQTNCESRPSSTVATQSLMLMNGDFMLQQAARLSAQSFSSESPELPATLPAELPQLPPPLPDLWQFGYGSFDEAAQRTGSFTLLPYWSGTDWQGSSERPDPQIGWVGLNAAGGHPGQPDFSPIRRFTAPTDGILKVTGMLSHGSENGDGVRARIVSSRSGLVGEWTALNGSAATAADGVVVAAGDAIDLIVDCIAHETSDSFQWPVQIVLLRDGAQVHAWASPDGFHGPLAAPTPLKPEHIVRAWQRAYLRTPTDDELRLAIGFIAGQVQHLRLEATVLPDGRTAEQQALVNLCQALLVSNEFLYVE